jgi:AcrR family transcriptional regulator
MRERASDTASGDTREENYVVSHVRAFSAALVCRPVNKREDVVEAAVELLLNGGPDALTTVAVAQRLGVTQSAIYRHVHSVDQLATLASRQIVGGLHELLNRVLLQSNSTWNEDGDTRLFSDLLVSAIAQEAKSFEVVDRWRFAEGELGAGIRDLLGEGLDIVAFILETEWRRDFDYHDDLTPVLQATLRAHAQLIQDDVISLARFVNQGRHPGGRDAIGRMLELRILAGYRAYAADANSRLGLRSVFS